jgi:hypothetical protein
VREPKRDPYSPKWDLFSLLISHLGGHFDVLRAQGSTQVRAATPQVERRK